MTPCAVDFESLPPATLVASAKQEKQLQLGAQVRMWPTIGDREGTDKGLSAPGLQEIARLWHPEGQTLFKDGDTPPRHARVQEIGGRKFLISGRTLLLRLNPRFTEWLMGWPVGWTDLTGITFSETQSSRWSSLMRSVLSGSG